MTVAEAQKIIDSKRLADAELIALARELGALPQRRYSAHDDTQRIAASPQDQTVPEGRENPLWEIVRLLPAQPTWYAPHRIEPNGHWAGNIEGDGLRRAYAAGLDRNALCARYAWSIPSPGDIAWLAKTLAGQGVAEIGAGSGYWAWQLAQAGVDVIAYDPHEPGPDNNYVQHRRYHPVRAGDHERAADHPDRALMLCWPSYGAPFAQQALHAYRGDTVVYIGEGEGGCCADDGFHRVLRRDFDETGSSPFHVTYWGIHCELTVCRRRDTPRQESAEA